MLRILPCFLMLSFLINCSAPKHSEEVTDGSDSAQFTDTRDEGYAYGDMADTSSMRGDDDNDDDLPAVNMDNIANDSTDDMLTHEMQGYLNKQKLAAMATITRNYSRRWSSEGGGVANDCSESESNIFYFDSLQHLRAYSQQYHQQGTYSHSEVTLYVFEHDSLTVAYVYESPDASVGMKQQTKYFKAKCPLCGTSLTKEPGSDEASIELLGKSEIKNIKNEVTLTISSLLGPLKSGWRQATKQDGIFTVNATAVKGKNEETPGTHYPVTYFVNEKLADGIDDVFVIKKF